MENKYTEVVNTPAWHKDYAGLGKGVEQDYSGATDFISTLPDAISSIVKEHELKIRKLREALVAQGLQIQNEMGNLKGGNAEVQGQIERIKGIQDNLQDKIKKLEDVLRDVQQMASDHGHDMGNLNPQFRTGGTFRAASGPEEKNMVDPDKFLARIKELLEEFQKTKEDNDKNIKQIEELKRQNATGATDRKRKQLFINRLLKEKQRMQDVSDAKTHKFVELLRDYDTLQSAMDKHVGVRQGPAGDEDESDTKSYSPKLDHTEPDHIKNYGTFNLMEYLETKYKEEKNKK